MKQYIDLLNRIIHEGVDIPAKDERTGAGCRSIFGHQLDFDISGMKIPMVTTRKVPLKPFVHETLFFISGRTNISALKEAGVKIWDDWAVSKESVIEYVDGLVKNELIKPEGAPYILDNILSNAVDEIGPMYGHLWRWWHTRSENIPTILVEKLDIADIPRDFMEGAKLAHEASLAAQQPDLPSFEDFVKISYLSVVDQLGVLITGLKKDPYSRRHIVTAVDPALFPIPGVAPNQQPLYERGALAPCHIGFEIHVMPPVEGSDVKRLVLRFSMRSWDVPLGGPTNIAGYALLAHLIAKEVGMEAVKLVVSAGNCHIYHNQLELAKEQVQRNPMEQTTVVSINTEDYSIFTVKPEDIVISGYDSYHGKIDYPINV